MAALSLISTLSDTGNMIAFGLKSTKFARVGQYIGAITQLVSNAATFTQAAISGLENAKAIFRNAKSGKLLSIDTASNVAALGLNLFTTIVSGKGAMTSGKNIKKMIGTDVGNKWGNKAKKEPLLECNLQFFADKSGDSSVRESLIQSESAKKWGVLDDGTNQGVKHFVDYGGQYPERISSLEERLGVNTGDFNNSLEGFENFTKQAGRVIDEATVNENVRNINGKSIYYVDGVVNPKKGVVVIVRDGKIQSMMPSDFKSFNKLQ